MRTIRLNSNQWSLKHCSVLCIIQLVAPFPQNRDYVPPHPPTDTLLKRPFVTSFNNRTHIPQRDNILTHWTKRSQNVGKVPKTTVLAHTQCP